MQKKNWSRKEWLSILAKSDLDSLSTLWKKLKINAQYEFFRKPEIGTVMVRGRSGGTGNSFNLGEITVSRCSVGLQTGEQGYGYIQGRSTEGATIAALVDAFMQTSHKKLIEQKILAENESLSDLNINSPDFKKYYLKNADISWMDVQGTDIANIDIKTQF